MRKIIKVLILSVAAAMSLLLAACGKSIIDSALVGDWTPLGEYGMAFGVSEDGRVEYYTVAENGEYIFAGEGNARLDGELIELVGEAYSLSGEYLIAGDSLLITSSDGEELMFGRTDFFNLELLIKKDPYAYIELGSLELELDEYSLDVEVSADELKAAVNELLAANPETGYVYDRAAHEGDSVNIDFIGYGGMGTSTGTLNSVKITLDGSSEADMEGFDAGIIGLKPGETATYEVKTLNDSGGRTKNTVTVTLNYIYEYSAAEYNDSFVRRISDMTTTTEYDEYLRALLLAQKKAEVVGKRREAIWNTVMERSVFVNFPEEECSARIEELTRKYEAEAESSGISFDAYAEKQYGMSETELREYISENTRENIKKEIMFSAVCRKAGISLTGGLYDEEIKKYSEAYGMTVEELEEYYGRDTLEFNVMRDLAEEYILSLGS